MSILLLATLALTAGVWWWLMSMSINAGENGMVFIPRNSSVVTAIDSVHQQCPLPTPWLVSMSARVAMRLRPLHVKSGWYLFQRGDSQLDVLEALFSGKRRPTVKVTLPEGLTKWETAGRLARALDVDSVLVQRELDTLEGKLFPNTYEFFWRESPAEVVARLSSEFERQTKKQPPTNDELILASIVQAEAASISEMPRIAGVYVNRLRLGMKLEADPTVQYGLQSRMRLTYNHLSRDHAWNTYMHSGLPVTPICSPGLAAITAAQHPEHHAFLFFVARSDGSGTHRFARTFGEHLKNVQAYRNSRR